MSHGTPDTDMTIVDTILDEEYRATPAPGSANETESATLSAAVAARISGLTLTPATGFPQYSVSTVSSTQVVTNYFLAATAGGGDFPADGGLDPGIASGLYVGTSQIFLFALDEDTIVGRIGSGTGAVALVIGLDEVKADGVVVDAEAQLWVALYAPLTHDGTNLVDANDVLDLTDLIFLGSDFDTSEEVGFDSFGRVPSGQNAFALISSTDPDEQDVELIVTGFGGTEVGTVNVSEQGLGEGSQSTTEGRSLRIDIVNAINDPNRSDDDYDLSDEPSEVHDEANLSYEGGHVLATNATFEIQQTNPNGNPATVSVFAYNTASNEQGAGFNAAAIAAPGTPVNIEIGDVRILNAAGVDITTAWLARNSITDIVKDGTYGVKITGLLVGEQVRFAPDAPFNRFVATNSDTTKGPDTWDMGSIKVTITRGGTDTEVEEAGSHIIFEDDGPTLTAAPQTAIDVIHDETSGLDSDADDVLGSAFLAGTSGPQVQDYFAGIAGGPIGYARSGSSLVSLTGDFGADGAGATPLAHGLVVTDGANSGVSTTGGTRIFLYNGSGATAGLILGRVGNEIAAGDTPKNDGAIAFALAVNAASGEVYVAQYLSLAHGDPTSSDERISLANGVLNMSVTRSDSEGDTVTDADNDIGAQVKFDDDGPAMTRQAEGSSTPNDLQVDNDLSDPGDSMDSSSFGLFAGADGQQSYSIVSGDTSTDFTWAYYDVDGQNGVENNEIRGSYKNNPLYTLELDNSGGYTFKMIGTLPGSLVPLSAEEIKAGGPNTNFIDVGALGPDPRFVRIEATGGPINESNDNVGVTNGNFDVGEALTFTFRDGTTELSFLGMNIGTKSASGGTYQWVAQKLGGGTIGDTETVGKNETIVIDTGGVLITSITLTKVSGSTTKIGLDDIDILVPPADITLDFTVRLTDGDGDSTDQSFSVAIDADNNGVFPALTSTLSESGGAELAMAPADPFATHQLEFQHHDYFLA